MAAGQGLLTACRPRSARGRLLAGVGLVLSVALAAFCIFAVRMIEDTAIEAARESASQSALRVVSLLAEGPVRAEEVTADLRILFATSRCEAGAVLDHGEVLAGAHAGGAVFAPTQIVPGTARIEGGRVELAMPVRAEIVGEDGVTRAGDTLAVACPTGPWTLRARVLELLLWVAAAAVLVIVLALSSVLLGRWIAGPVEALTREFEHAADHVGADRADTRDSSGRDTESMDELGRLAFVLSRFRGRIEEDRGRIANQLAALRSAHSELEDATSQLVRTERLATVGMLASGVAHEVGNPLAIALGYLETAERPGLGEDDRRQALSEVSRALGRIDRVIRDLLAFSRPERKEAGQIDARDVLDQVTSLVRVHRKMREVVVDGAVLDALSPEERLVDVSPAHLEQILVNLMLNAADAMGGHGTIRVTAAMASGFLVMDVCDDGPGIPAGGRERVFEPFYTTKSSSEGTGLGLSVSRRIAETYGGRLEAVDPPGGQGACLRLWLPNAVASV